MSKILGKNDYFASHSFCFPSVYCRSNILYIVCLYIILFNFSNISFVICKLFLLLPVLRCKHIVRGRWDHYVANKKVDTWMPQCLTYLGQSWAGSLHKSWIWWTTMSSANVRHSRSPQLSHHKRATCKWPLLANWSLACTLLTTAFLTN